MIPAEIAVHIDNLVRARPPELIATLARVLEATTRQTSAQARGVVMQVLPHADVRSEVAQLLDAWEVNAPWQPRVALAWALAAASQAVQATRQEQQAALVWTGPQIDGPALRRTDQALQEVIGVARQELLLVSFAVYMVPHIAQALVNAAGRGVKIRIALETPTESAGRIDYNTVRSLGADVARNAELYIWPESQRGRDAQGNLGALHAKCAVADRQLLFISSANLTGYALTINMELGVMIRGGALPGDVATLYARMIEHGVLQRIAS